MANISFSIPTQEEISHFLPQKLKYFEFSPFLRLGHVPKMFLNFRKFEPQRSYKHGSYSTFSVYLGL